jgi:hypothetical protein
LLTAEYQAAERTSPQCLRNGGMPSGNGYAAVQPDLGLSWLNGGWNLSADLHLAIQVTADAATNYT